MTTTPLDVLIEELEETLYAVGEVAPFEFTGYARAATTSDDPAVIDPLCQQAYEALNNRFALHLEWRRWGGEDLGPAEPGTPYDFYPDSDKDVTIPYLVVVPDDPDSVSDELGKRYHPHGRPTAKRHWWQRER